MTSLTLPSQGQTVTVVRDGQPQGLRADVVLRATGDAIGWLDVRQAILDQGLLTSPVMSLLVKVEIDGDRWLLTDPDGGVLVLVATETGDHLMLDLDRADPRLTAIDPPEQIMLDRAEAWPTTTVGSWDLLSMELPGGTVTPDQCVLVNPVGIWAKVAMRIDFDDRLLFTRTMTTSRYGESTCTTRIALDTEVQTGMAEEQTGTLAMWSIDEDDRGGYIAFAMQEAGDQLTLTRASCLPWPDCDGDAPRTVVVQRHVGP